MKRETILLVATVSVALFAGCGGLLQGDSTTGNTTEAQGYLTDGGSLDPGLLIRAHNDALETAGSYTVDFRQSGDSIEFGGTLRKAASGEMRLNSTAAGGNARTDGYVDETGTQYIQQREGSAMDYFAFDQPYRENSPSDVGMYITSGVLENGTGFTRATTTIISVTNWDDQGETTYDGAAARKFTATGPGAIRNANVVEYNATLYVSPDGVVRRLNATLVNEQGNSTSEVQFQATVSGVGNTDVEAPDWLDEAKAQTGNS